MGMRRVVVTGMGAVSPLGCGVPALWNAVLAGQSGIGPITRFDTAGFDVHIGGQCRDFNVVDYIDRKQAKRLDRFAQFGLVASIQAGRDAHIDVDTLDPHRVGVILGSGIGGIQELEDQHIRLRTKGASKVSAFTIPKLMGNAASAHIAIHFGAKGTSTAVATACASATNAMGDAMRAIQRNEVDVVFSGGSEAALTPLGVAAFAAMHALSTRNDEPERASRPFDVDRGGFVLSEGAGVLVLEELEHARRRGVTIHAEIKGFGASTDAGHIAQPLDDGSGAARAMRTAMEEAHASPERISYINAHGTGTPLGDKAEVIAIRTVFGSHAEDVTISSTKGATGHLLGASGGVETIATILALNGNVAPPTVNLEKVDPECRLNHVMNQARDLRIDLAMNNSFGFGGHNACLVIGRVE